MRALPNPPRDAGFADPEAVVDAMRRWLWALADLGVDFTDPPRWTHDDNRNAQTYGFAILAVADLASKQLVYKLLSLDRSVTNEQIEKRLVALAPLDPLCAKAVGILTGAKLRGNK